MARRKLLPAGKAVLPHLGIPWDLPRLHADSKGLDRAPIISLRLSACSSSDISRRKSAPLLHLRLASFGEPLRLSNSHLEGL